MKFASLPIAGAFLVEIEPATDERGTFARTYCEREFAAHGIAVRFVQCNVSVTNRRGMLRGLHLQARRSAEAKLVRCVRGSAYDVMVDLRPASATFMRWHAVQLDAAARNATFIPEGCAHGFQALSDDCELFYQMSAFYAPEAKRGFRWDDPAFSVRWPIAEPMLSAADLALPVFDRQAWQREWEEG